jgi:hypothetical protein
VTRAFRAFRGVRERSLLVKTGPMPSCVERKMVNGVKMLSGALGTSVGLKAGCWIWGGERNVLPTRKPVILQVEINSDMVTRLR